MAENTVKQDLSLQQCAESLARQAENKTHDGSEAMRFSQAAVNITNAMMNLRNMNLDLKS